MKADIAGDVDMGPVHTVTSTMAKAHDITQAAALLLGQEEVVFFRLGLPERSQARRRTGAPPRSGLAKCRDACPTQGYGHRQVRQPAQGAVGEDQRQHPRKGRVHVRATKCQFEHRKARYRGLAKKTSQSLVMFALSNL